MFKLTKQLISEPLNTYRNTISQNKMFDHCTPPKNKQNQLYKRKSKEIEEKIKAEKKFIGRNEKSVDKLEYLAL